MANFKPQIPSLKSQIVLWVGGLLLLGALAWGIGWTAHGLFDRFAPPVETVEPTAVPPTVANGPTTPPTLPPSATPTQPPESTTAPVPATSTVVPTADDNVETIVVEANDRGVYDVVRRACGLSGNYTLSPDDEIVQETWKLNGFVEENPPIIEGQEIQVPIHLCP